MSISTELNTSSIECKSYSSAMSPEFLNDAVPLMHREKNKQQTNSVGSYKRDKQTNEKTDAHTETNKQNTKCTV